MRRTITISLVLTGLALMLIGYFTAAPWGTDSVENSNPVVTGAPMLFILGIISVIAAAVLYEVLPDRRR